MSERDAGAFREVLWHLRHFLPELVLIGGWVPHLYRHYGPFAEWRSELAFTEELDVLVESQPPVTGHGTLGATLSKAGFAPVDREAAVWEKASAGSQRIEFLTPHRGIARSRATVMTLQRNPKLGALALEGLELLRDFTRELEVPVGIHVEQFMTVQLRVPSLGAYMLSKAITFPRRPGESLAGGQPKRAKDILYLRDIASAGPEVVNQVELDVQEIASSGRASAVRAAQSNLYLLLHGAMAGYLTEAAEMLAERDKLQVTAAAADLRGHVTDFHEILEEAVSL